MKELCTGGGGGAVAAGGGGGGGGGAAAAAGGGAAEEEKKEEEKEEEEEDDVSALIPVLDCSMLRCRSHCQSCKKQILLHCLSWTVYHGRVCYDQGRSLHLL